MAIKYYYIDDDPLSTIEETAKGLSTSPKKLLVTPFQHKLWQEEIDFLCKNQESFDGLLLDWGLSQKNNDGEKANFKIEALAQQIRSLIADGKKFKKDFPIILCSAQHRFQRVYEKEVSSHDLFDAIYEKDDFSETTDIIVAELIDIALGYQIIQDKLKTKPITKAIGEMLSIDTVENVDYRLITYLESLLKDSKPANEIARFIQTKLIKPQGILLDQYLLASRLGVDITKKPSGNDWEKLLRKLSAVKYNGVFSNAWDRWWMEKLLDWWKEISDSPLGEIDGPTRVGLINKKYKLNLNPAQKTSKSKSDYFWTICKETKIPISISDSFLMPEKFDKSPWEEDDYLSIDSALEQNATNVHSLEKERLKNLKKLYAKVRQK